MFTVIFDTDAGGLVAAEGATYVVASDIPYKFKMAAVVEGYNRVMCVTSDRLKLDVQFEDNHKKAVV